MVEDLKNRIDASASGLNSSKLSKKTRNSGQRANSVVKIYLTGVDLGAKKAYFPEKKVVKRSKSTGLPNTKSEITLSEKPKKVEILLGEGRNNIPTPVPIA